MSDWSPNSKYDHAFAIVRIDDYQGAVDLETEPEVVINVKKIVWAQEVAESEVARLNKLNKNKGATYYWTITRVERKAPQSSRT
jgi:hypothetical protein